MRRLLLLVFLLAVAVAHFVFIRQQQPPGEQQPRIGPAAIYPDTRRTPGFANPGITQANLADTVCSHEWSTLEIRPA